MNTLENGIIGGVLGGVIGATLHVSNNQLARLPYFYKFQNKTLLSYSLKKVALIFALAIAGFVSLNTYAGHSLKPTEPTPLKKKHFIALCTPILIGSSLATLYVFKKIGIFEENMTIILLIILAGNVYEIIKFHNSIKS